MKKILVVDDSESVRQRVRSALAPAGFEVLEAADGQQGWAVIQAAGDLSLVLCDVHMPNMSGLEVLAKAREQGVSVPIVMLTSEALPSLVKQARESGAKGWIVKPFSVDRLVAAVSKITSANLSLV